MVFIFGYLVTFELLIENMTKSVPQIPMHPFCIFSKYQYLTIPPVKNYYKQITVGMTLQNSLKSYTNILTCSTNVLFLIQVPIQGHMFHFRSILKHNHEPIFDIYIFWPDTVVEDWLACFIIPLILECSLWLSSGCTLFRRLAHRWCCVSKCVYQQIFLWLDTTDILCICGYIYLFK